MPLIFVGCGLILLLGDWAVTLVFTENYLMSSTIFKWLIPLLIFAFPAMLYGWPALDCINKTKATTISTIIGAVIQVTGLGIIAIIGQFNLITIAIVRNISEAIFCIIRMSIVYKNKKLYTNSSAEEDILIVDNSVEEPNKEQVIEISTEEEVKESASTKLNKENTKK